MTRISLHFFGWLLLWGCVDATSVPGESEPDAAADAEASAPDAAWVDPTSPLGTGCAEGAFPIPGGCSEPWPCPAGWTRAPVGPGCRAPSPPACPDDSGLPDGTCLAVWPCPNDRPRGADGLCPAPPDCARPLPDGTCVNLRPCGPGPFAGRDWPPGTVFVAADADPAVADGTVDRPWPTLDLALVPDGGTIALGAGDYDLVGNSEKSLTISGLCPDRSALVTGLRQTRGTLRLQDLAVHNNQGLVVGGDLVLAGVVVSGASVFAFGAATVRDSVFLPGQASLEGRSLIERSHIFAARVTGEAIVRNSRVSHLRAADGGQVVGDNLVIAGGVVAGEEEAGVLAGNGGSDVALVRTVAENAHFQTAFHPGYVARLQIEALRGHRVQFYNSSEMVLRDVDLRGGLKVERGVVQAERLRVRAAEGPAIHFRGGRIEIDTARIEGDVLMYNLANYEKVLVARAMALERGTFVADGPRADMHLSQVSVRDAPIGIRAVAEARVVVEDADLQGISVIGLAVECSTVEASRVAVGLAGGHGAAVGRLECYRHSNPPHGPARLTLRHFAVEGGAVGIQAAIDNDLTVEDAWLGPGSGRGIDAAIGTTLRLSRFSMENRADTGLAVHDTRALVEIERGLIRGTVAGALGAGNGLEVVLTPSRLRDLHVVETAGDAVVAVGTPIDLEGLRVDGAEAGIFGWRSSVTLERFHLRGARAAGLVTSESRATLTEGLITHNRQGIAVWPQDDITLEDVQLGANPAGHRVDLTTQPVSAISQPVPPIERPPLERPQ